MTETDSIDGYAAAHSDPEGQYLHRLWRATNLHTVHGHMASGHLQGRLLKMLVMMQRPRYILEVGTFSGYSAICMAEGLREVDASDVLLKKESGDWRRETGDCQVPQDTQAANHTSVSTLQSPVSQAANHKVQSSKLKVQRQIVTFEINDEMEDFTRRWIEGSEVARYIDFRIGDAITDAPKLGLKFDMAFIDGDKRTYVETFDAIFPLMNDGAIILADNTLWDGHVLDPAYDRDAQTIGIRRFNDYIAADQRVEKVVVPIRDGLTIMRKLP